jgi:glycosyltransferase involved in cell wall biosynthesis
VRVSFLVPAFNEAATIGEVLERVDALELDKPVIAVDDGSTERDGLKALVILFKVRFGDRPPQKP